MFRLILEDQKKKLKKSYRGRFLICFFFLLLLLLFGYLVSIFPRYSALRSEIISIRESVHQAEGAELTTLRQELVQLSDEVSRQANRLPSERPLPSTIINEITSKQNIGTGFDTIDISYLENEYSVSVRGVASNRDSLQKFIASLEESEIFGTTTLPVSQLVQSDDIPFSLTFPLKK